MTAQLGYGTLHLLRQENDASRNNRRSSYYENLNMDQFFVAASGHFDSRLPHPIATSLTYDGQNGRELESEVD